MTRTTVVTLPTLHADQVRAYWAYRRTKRFVLRAGRRYGKTLFLETVACDCALSGGKVGWFVPETKYATESFLDMKAVLQPVLASSSRVEGVLRLGINSGRIDMWSLKDNELAGRGRDYDLAVFDEHAFNKPSVRETWEKAVRPTLFDRSGRAIFASNTRGIDDDNHFYQLHGLAERGEQDFVEYHAPTSANPLLPKRLSDETEESHARRRLEAIEQIRAENAPLVFQQEFEASFVSWAGEAFFDLQKLLDQGLPVAYPPHCDYVFATVDTAVKTGRENDGTAVAYWARTFPGFGPHQLVLLDWDLIQIEGSLLEAWLPGVFQNLEGLARQCRARGGSAGVYVEDKSSGMVLLQNAARKGWPAHPIDSKLTAMGKVERCISASGPVYRGLVKISQPAHDKVVTYKGATANHLLKQVLSFRVDDKDPTRQDDGLDVFTYGVLTALGSAEGFG